MKIACVADAHGANRKIEQLVAALPPVDAFCFLGDVETDGEYLQLLLADVQPHAAFHAVAGNNDPGSSLPQSLELILGKTRTFITHGHLYRVRLSSASLAAHARARDCTLALFGHTHIPYNARVDGVRLVNPGALRDGRWALVDTDTEEAALLTLSNT